MSGKLVQKPPTVITLTLPDGDDETRTGTLLVQRGDLARVHQFTYERVADLTEIIADALIAFAAVEADPPVITDAPPPRPVSTKKAEPTTERTPQPPTEPTVDIPLKKGKKTIKISHLKIVSGETDAAAYRQAVQIASLLIEGKLWDGETPIRIDDVYAVAKKMKHLTARDLSLFTLTDFVQVGAVEQDTASVESDDEIGTDGDGEDESISLMPPRDVAPSANGHHS
jgi:hypothetical protein